LITAGFWSKDEILADAFANGHLAVFITLALAAFLTAFYTMRQITLTFLGDARTKAAEHAHESVWTMTLPLIVLSFFAIAAGWVGIPEGFPAIGGLIPNWFHEFISGSLLEHPQAIAFNPVPLLVSIGVALGGLLLGWLVYRRVPTGGEDPVKKPLGPIYSVLRNKYYFDELYSAVIVRPAYWIAETVVYRWIDRGVIDGFLHGVARATLRIGDFLRNSIDLPIVNGAGDFVGEGVKKTGKTFRVIQTGRVQEYLIIGMVFAGLVLSYILILRP